MSVSTKNGMIPDIPDQADNKVADQKLAYSDVYKKSKVANSGGSDVKMEWQGRTLTTADMKKLYKGAD